MIRCYHILKLLCITLVYLLMSNCKVHRNKNSHITFKQATVIRSNTGDTIAKIKQP